MEQWDESEIMSIDRLTNLRERVEAAGATATKKANGRKTRKIRK
jgi:hypothetical protein